MSDAFLEVTFRRGRPFAAYYSLARTGSRKSVRQQLVEPGMVIDFGEDDEPLGIEITAPALTTLDALNCVLDKLGLAPATPEDFAPLRAAS